MSVPLLVRPVTLGKPNLALSTILRKTTLSYYSVSSGSTRFDAKSRCVGHVLLTER